MNNERARIKRKIVELQQKLAKLEKNAEIEERPTTHYFQGSKVSCYQWNRKENGQFYNVFLDIQLESFVHHFMLDNKIETKNNVEYKLKKSSKITWIATLNGPEMAQLHTLTIRDKHDPVKKATFYYYIHSF